jgi:hypothetical protein
VKTIVACILTALLVGATSAGAATLITSARIKDGTIQYRDLSKSLKLALAAKSAPAGASTPVAGSPGAVGPQGATGATGAAGPQGPAGTNGVDGTNGTSVQGAPGTDCTGQAPQTPARTCAGEPGIGVPEIVRDRVFPPGLSIDVHCSPGKRPVSGMVIGGGFAALDIRNGNAPIGTAFTPADIPADSYLRITPNFVPAEGIEVAAVCA